MGGGGKKDKRVKQTGELEEEIEIKVKDKINFSQLSGAELREELLRYDIILEKEFYREKEARDSALVEKDKLKVIWEKAREDAEAARDVYQNSWSSNDHEEIDRLRKIRDLTAQARADAYEKYDDALTIYRNANAVYTKARSERESVIRDWFKVPPLVNPKIKINIDKSTDEWKELEKHQFTRLEPQRVFLENVFSQAGKEIKFDVHVTKGSGGVSYWHRLVELGAFSSETTPLHEFMHQAEDQLGVRLHRMERVKQYIEKKTGKKMEDIEMREWVDYVSSSGKKHRRGVYYGSKIWVPKDMFPKSGSKEEQEWGYMLRAYDSEIVTKEVKTKSGKTVTKRFLRGDANYGREVMTVGIENIYSNPIEFSKVHPEIFDIVVDVVRGKGAPPWI